MDETLSVCLVSIRENKQKNDVLFLFFVFSRLCNGYNLYKGLKVGKFCFLFFNFFCHCGECVTTVCNCACVRVGVIANCLVLPSIFVLYILCLELYRRSFCVSDGKAWRKGRESRGPHSFDWIGVIVVFNFLSFLLSSSWLFSAFSFSPPIDEFCLDLIPSSATIWMIEDWRNDS